MVINKNSSGGRTASNLRYADDTIFLAETEELVTMLKSVRRHCAKAGYELHLNLKKTKIMGTGPFGEVLSEGEKVEIVNNFIYLGLKINQDASCENEIIRCITMGMHAIRSLMKIWKNIGIFKNDKNDLDVCPRVSNRYCQFGIIDYP